MLVPEATYQQLIGRESSSLLQAINHSERRELVKQLQSSQNVLHDESIQKETRVDMYNEGMDTFSLLKEKVKGVNRVKPADGDAFLTDLVGLMPESVKVNAKQLLDRLKDNEDMISWSPSGEVSVHGKRLDRSNLVDLVGDVMRSTKIEHPNRNSFFECFK